ncbi:MAG: hypothetical protein AB7N80_04575 [Bdellovibrionales bacterium]
MGRSGQLRQIQITHAIEAMDSKVTQELWSAAYFANALSLQMNLPRPTTCLRFAPRLERRLQMAR